MTDDNTTDDYEPKADGGRDTASDPDKAEEILDLAPEVCGLERNDWDTFAFDLPRDMSGGKIRELKGVLSEKAGYTLDTVGERSKNREGYIAEPKTPTDARTDGGPTLTADGFDAKQVLRTRLARGGSHDG